MASLARSNTKRRREAAAEDVSLASASPSKRQQQRRSELSADDAKGQLIASDLEGEKRHLAKLFQALETSLLASLSLTPSFHMLQDAVTYTARSNFELAHLAQIAGVWPSAYAIQSVMTLHKGVLQPSLSISPGTSTRAGQSTSPAARQEQFKQHLAQWQGQSATLPEMKHYTHSATLDAGRQSLLNKPVKPTVTEEETPTLLRGTASARESALLDRILAKKRARLEQGVTTPEDLTRATVLALVPTALTSIKLLLASKPKAAAKSLGMRQLVDNLKTSLRARTGEAEIVQIIEQLALQYPAWCKIGQVGPVQVVRFIGDAPRI